MKNYTGIIKNPSPRCEGEFYAFFTRLGKRLYAGSHPSEDLASLRHDEAQFLSRCWCSGRKPSYNDPDTFEKPGCRVPKTQWSEEFLEKAAKTLKVPLPEGFDPYYEPEAGEEALDDAATPPEVVKDLILGARAAVRQAQQHLDRLLHLQNLLTGKTPAAPAKLTKITEPAVTPSLPNDVAQALPDENPPLPVTLKRITQ